MKNVMSFFLGVIIMIVILIGGRYYKLAHNKPQIVMNTLHRTRGHIGRGDRSIVPYPAGELKIGYIILVHNLSSVCTGLFIF
ncbi:hypothetical protein JOC73_001598 [Alkaliphilus hydrothermalis]|uniref:Uncharacterized protein n=1 Tax=Alkaliphilus hydrothermalis TaxID=1482730 RepID=A0ABS2NQC0_9FIRM|nr:hypothetical protein [Alkaliphilus hydrothermalis]